MVIFTIDKKVSHTNNTAPSLLFFLILLLIRYIQTVAIYPTTLLQLLSFKDGSSSCDGPNAIYTTITRKQSSYHATTTSIILTSDDQHHNNLLSDILHK